MQPLMPLFSPLAEAETPAAEHFHLAENFWPGFVGAIIYGILALVLALLGFKLFDWITPRIDVQHELGEKHNMAVAIVCAAIILGSCYLVARILAPPV